MPMVRAMRMLNAIEAGTLSSGQLDTLLADPGRMGEFQQLMAMRGQARRMFAAATSVAVIFGSSLAFAEVVVSRNAMAMLAESQVATDALVASSPRMTQAAASAVAMKELASSQYAMSKIAASATTMAIIGASATAVSAVADSRVAMDEVFAVENASRVFFGSLVTLGLTATVDAFVDSDDSMSRALNGKFGAVGIASTAGVVSAINASIERRNRFWGAPSAGLGGHIGLIESIGADKWLFVLAPKANELASVQWKATNDNSPNTDDEYFGLANANAQNNAQHPMFQQTRAMTHGGKTDWAPPAKIPLEKMVAKYRRDVAENPLFKAGGSEVFEGTTYWSATQHPSSPDAAWYVDFSGGSTNFRSKNSTYRCRAVRMLKL